MNDYLNCAGHSCSEEEGEMRNGRTKKEKVENENPSAQRPHQG
jgi:hypothetical protein